MKVDFIDLKSRYKLERLEILGTLDKVLKKGHLVLTNELEEFVTFSLGLRTMFFVVGYFSTCPLSKSLLAFNIFFDLSFDIRPIFINIKESKKGPEGPL